MANNDSAFASATGLCQLCGSREHSTDGHGAHLGSPWWTVCGVWPDTKERWADFYQDDTARGAEDQARYAAKEEGAVLWVTNVFPGQLTTEDTYAKFADDPDKTTEANF